MVVTHVFSAKQQCGVACGAGHRVGPARRASTRSNSHVRSSADIDAAYTSDRLFQDGPAVVTGPVEDSHRSMRANAWPPKSSMYLFRTDGKSCTRELVTGNGSLQFSHPSTQQHLLVWREKPRVAMVIKKLGAALTQHFLEVVTYLGEVEQVLVVVEPAMYDVCIEAGINPQYVFSYSPQELQRLGEHVDFLVCLGGDGVLLHASGLFTGALPPVLTFHLGSMGFLTNHEFTDYKRHLRQVIYGSQLLETCSLDSVDSANRMGVMITLRMRLKCVVLRRNLAQPDQAYEVLNEVVVDRGSNSYLTNVEVWIDGHFVARAQADGIMLATPTGSTAYSLAAGGSMVHPNVPAILLTPICPHSLNFRPVILPDYVQLELRVPDEARCSVWVCFDGKSRQELHRGDRIVVKMSEHPVPTINKCDLTSDWFDSLERCFRWSNRTEQKPLDATGDVSDEAEEVAAFRSRRPLLFGGLYPQSPSGSDADASMTDAHSCSTATEEEAGGGHDGEGSEQEERGAGSSAVNVSYAAARAGAAAGGGGGNGQHVARVATCKLPLREGDVVHTLP